MLQDLLRGESYSCTNMIKWKHISSNIGRELLGEVWSDVQKIVKEQIDDEVS